MTRYIDADALIKGIDIKVEITDRDEANKVANAFCEIISRIKNAPTADVVEVVRCKDCVYCEPYAIDTGEDCMTGLWCGENQKDTTLQDFCSYGEWR